MYQICSIIVQEALYREKSMFWEHVFTVLLKGIPAWFLQDGPALLNKFINIWLIQSIILKSGDCTKVGNTARNMYTEFNTILQISMRRIQLSTENTLLCTQACIISYTGKKKNTHLKIELCLCQSFRKRPTGYGRSQAQHESPMSCCCEKCRYYTDKWSFCSTLHWQDFSWLFLCFWQPLKNFLKLLERLQRDLEILTYGKDWMK